MSNNSEIRSHIRNIGKESAALQKKMDHVRSDIRDRFSSLETSQKQKIEKTVEQSLHSNVVATSEGYWKTLDSLKISKDSLLKFENTFNKPFPIGSDIINSFRGPYKELLKSQRNLESDFLKAKTESEIQKIRKRCEEQKSSCAHFITRTIRPGSMLDYQKISINANKAQAKFEALKEKLARDKDLHGDRYFTIINFLDGKRKDVIKQASSGGYLYEIRLDHFIILLDNLEKSVIKKWLPLEKRYDEALENYDKSKISQVKDKKQALMDKLNSELNHLDVHEVINKENIDNAWIDYFDGVEKLTIGLTSPSMVTEGARVSGGINETGSKVDDSKPIVEKEAIRSTSPSTEANRVKVSGRETSGNVDDLIPTTQKMNRATVFVTEENVEEFKNKLGEYINKEYKSDPEKSPFRGKRLDELFAFPTDETAEVKFINWFQVVKEKFEAWQQIGDSPENYPGKLEDKLNAKDQLIIVCKMKGYDWGNEKVREGLLNQLNKVTKKLAIGLTSSSTKTEGTKVSGGMNKTVGKVSDRKPIVEKVVIRSTSPSTKTEGAKVSRGMNVTGGKVNDLRPIAEKEVEKIKKEIDDRMNDKYRFNPQKNPFRLVDVDELFAFPTDETDKVKFINWFQVVKEKFEAWQQIGDSPEDYPGKREDEINAMDQLIRVCKMKDREWENTETRERLLKNLG